jgi:DnaJ-class molecular chaperone
MGWAMAHDSDERSKSFDIVALITPKKARTGGKITVRVPIHRSCPGCNGTGRDWLADCVRCWGDGTLAIEEPVSIDVPAFSGNRAMLELSLSIGLRPLRLRVNLRVT